MIQWYTFIILKERYILRFYSFTPKFNLWNMIYDRTSIIYPTNIFNYIVNILPQYKIRTKQEFAQANITSW